jgi:hypothetical protein
MEQNVCLVCGGRAEPYDCCDFSKHCDYEENPILIVPLSMKPVYYHRCHDCGFVFAPEICLWSHQQFMDEIYNDEYVKFDPDFVESRPKANADFLACKLQPYRESLTILDYGGGNGQMVAFLRQAGFNAYCYDPFYISRSTSMSSHYDFIAAFEVFEHAADPKQMIIDLTGFLKQNGVIYFTTLVSDGHILNNRRLTWWYASPRNGHISLYTTKSLRHLGAQCDLELISFSQSNHMFFRELPDWAREIFSIKRS